MYGFGLLSNFFFQTWYNDRHHWTLHFDFSFFLFCIPSYISMVHHFWWDFCVCGGFLINPNHRCSHIQFSWMMHVGCVFVAGFHLSRTWMSGSFEFVWWNACAHRLDLGLSSHPKQFLGNGVRTHVSSKRRIPSTGGSEEGWTCNIASLGQRAQHANDWAIPALISV